MDVTSSSSLDFPQLFRQFTIYEIHTATKNFDESLVIGRGGFGKVYKGTISDGTTHLVAAIKRLDLTSDQGEVEFWNEVHMLSKLRHCHLVSLIGYCKDGQEMILVYEYMPHGTLDDHLHKFKSTLPWVRRLKICVGAARGLDYLHTGTGIKTGIIHRDVKSSNILLDDSWAAKISDFGLSKLGPINQPSTYVNTNVKGTTGYLDPDYYATGRLTRKSDVYAFGVVLLEVLSGKKAVDRSLDEEHWGLVNWAQESIKKGRLKQIVEWSIRERILPKCLKDFGRLADRCLHSNPKQRPSMAEVVGRLESVLALQEKAKAYNTVHPAGLRIFGNKVPMFMSSSNSEKSVESKISKSWELFLDTVGGENRILQRFEFGTIKVATENFSENNKILKRDIDTLYKGRLQNGQRVSIVRFQYSHFHEEEIKTGVSLLVKLQHENLLKLLGYSIEGIYIFLVYEFAFFASLDRLIGDPECIILDWDKRNKIILGVARALLYLHQHGPFRIIHRDVKSSNIILDESLDPKLSNLGSARCLAINEADCIQEESFHGTWGYIAPEYIISSSLSTKADVYSFGVLILETISGRTRSNYLRNNRMDPWKFGEYAWEHWLEGTCSNIIDPRIQVHSSSITRVIHIGLLCIQVDPVDRPTMEEVLGMLTNTSSLTLPIPKKPIPSWKIEEDSDSDSDYLDAQTHDFDSGEVEETISELFPG